ncbi:MAG: hypothetical protein QNJ46_13300 [Leptolyngbyaceae cyanobacterium MO_188.B28]|nr:hypothetical protein [Leptolyngbyaceae cyanobacterium MO_188.B28]
MTTSVQLLTATLLSLPILLLGGQAVAIPPDGSTVPQDFLTINSSSRRFFESGNDRFEQEIDALLRGDFAFSEDLLIIDEAAGIEDDWERLEGPNRSLEDIEQIEMDLP